MVIQPQICFTAEINQIKIKTALFFNAVPLVFYLYLSRFILLYTSLDAVLL